MSRQHQKQRKYVSHLQYKIRKIRCQMMLWRLDTDRLKRGLNKLMEDRSISDYEAEWPQIQLWLRTVLNCWLSKEGGILPYLSFPL